MRDTCHHCRKDESVAVIVVNPGDIKYPVCNSCYRAISIGHEIPHVFGVESLRAIGLDKPTRMQPPYRDSAKPGDIDKVRERYGPPPWVGRDEGNETMYSYQTWPGQTIVRSCRTGYTYEELIDELMQNGEGVIVANHDYPIDENLSAIDGMKIDELRFHQ